MSVKFEPDGAFTITRGSPTIPVGWIPDPNTPGRYVPPWKPCRFRMVSKHTNHVEIIITPHCDRTRQNTTADCCTSCPHAQSSGTTQTLPLEDEHGNSQGTQTVTVYPVSDTQVARHGVWQPESIKRSPLADIEHTLPVYVEKRDRKVRFETDGSITYEQEEGWESPRDINGYERDPNNPWHFIPLWPECSLRHGVGVRYANCGCIGIIMRCNNPDAIQFGDRIGHEQCRACQRRKI